MCVLSHTGIVFGPFVWHAIIMGHRLKVMLAVWLLSIPALAQTSYVKLTYYHPVKSECYANPLITADGSKIDLQKLKQGKVRWCAVSRDLLPLFPKGKPKRLWIEGYGIYEVHDVTNKRIKNTVDILLHPASKEKIYHKRIKIRIIK